MKKIRYNRGESVLRQRNLGISPVVYPNVRKFMEEILEDVRNFPCRNRLDITQIYLVYSRNRRLNSSILHARGC